MYTLILRDISFRKSFFQSEKTTIIYRWLLKKKYKNKHLFLLKLFLQQGKRSFRDRCLYTQRGRSIYKNYQMSRLTLKFFFDNVFFVGIKSRNAK